IGAATFADFALVWARDTADQQIKGFLVQMDLPGVSAEKINNKIGLRVMQNADLSFDQVEISDADALPGAAKFEAANGMLRNSRICVGGEALGAQLHAFDVARDYALDSQQFGRPLAKSRLIQQDRAEMISNASACSGRMQQIARLQTAGSVDKVHAEMANSTGTRRWRGPVARP